MSAVGNGYLLIISFTRHWKRLLPHTPALRLPLRREKTSAECSFQLEWRRAPMKWRWCVLRESTKESSHVSVEGATLLHGDWVVRNNMIPESYSSFAVTRLWHSQYKLPFDFFSFFCFVWFSCWTADQTWQKMVMHLVRRNVQCASFTSNQNLLNVSPLNFNVQITLYIAIRCVRRHFL